MTTYKCNKCGRWKSKILDGLICTCTDAVYETIKAPAPPANIEQYAVVSVR